MLSSIGRAAVRRLTATSISTSCRRIAVSQVAVRQAFKQPVTVAYLRSFATARGTAKKPAAKTAAAKKTTTATKKKPGPKKTTKAKKKAAPKKKAVRKVLTPEKQAEVKAKAQIKELKEKALFNEPKGLPTTAYQIYFVESMKNEYAPGQNVTELAARFGQAFKHVSSSELDRFGEVAEKNKLANAASYKAWVERHTALEIYDANNARKLLKRKYNLPKSRQNPKLIKDDRTPTRPLTAYAAFLKSRWGSGDFSGVKVPEASQTIRSEWKALSDSEKQHWVDLGKQDVKRYEKEVEAAFGRSPSP